MKRQALLREGQLFMANTGYDAIALRYFFFLLLSLASCKKEEIVQPPPAKDPRTYSWMFDTLAYPGSLQTLMLEIWGNNSSDVHVVGHNDGGFGKMYHFDGTRWSPIEIRPGGDVNGIYGFAANNVWAVGGKIFGNPNPPPNFLDSSLVLRFDGTTWRSTTLPAGKELFAVWGASPNDIWMGGEDVIFHWDGVSIKRDSLPLPTNEYLVLALTGKQNAETYAFVNLIHGGERFFICERRNNSWRVADSSASLYGVELWVSPGGNLYLTGDGVRKRQGNTWQQMLSLAVTCRDIGGTSDTNLFAVGWDGELTGAVFQFNGVDWFRFPQLQLRNVTFNGVWVGKDQAIVIGDAFVPGRGRVTIVAHGR